MDDPQHAAGALEAANSLAKIAPDAGHSQHMTAHIFIALGRWPDVVKANIAAMGVVNADHKAKGEPEYQCGHYAEWLEYAWLQQGREDQAVGLLSECERTGKAAVTWMRDNPGKAYGSAKRPEDLQQTMQASLEHMRAMALVDGGGHRMELLGAAGANSGEDLVFADGLVRAIAGDTVAARQVLAKLQKLVQPTTLGDASPYTGIMARMLEAQILAREGKGEDALALLRKAAEDYEAQPFDFGPPATVKPPRELLGEMLLAAGRREEARAEFERALATAPQRRAALLGRERASAAP
jgi:tetratricopeptide (TPR) repeat protein